VNPWVPIVLGVVGAVISGYVAWLIARRQRSGKIDTTEAGTLWAEGQAMRHELREDLVALRADAQTARLESTGLRTELAALRAESVTTRAEMVALREESAALRKEVIGLRGQLAAEEASRQDLTEKVDDLGTKLEEEP
jgi:hypothetical protein